MRGLSSFISVDVGLALIALLLAAVGARADDAHPRIPEVIGSKAGTEGAAWVSASAAVSADNSFDLRPFTGISHQVVARRLEAITRSLELQGPQTDSPQAAGRTAVACPSLAITVAEVPQSAGAFLQSAHSVVVGTVADVDVGFSFGTDASMVSLRVSRVIRAGYGIEDRGELLVVVPYARFEVAGIPFCRGVELAGGYQVTVGDAVLVVLDQPSVDPESKVFWAPAHGVLFGSASRAGLVVPPAFHELFGAPPSGVAEELALLSDERGDAATGIATPALEAWLDRLVTQTTATATTS